MKTLSELFEIDEGVEFEIFDGNFFKGIYKIINNKLLIKRDGKWEDNQFDINNISKIKIKKPSLLTKAEHNYLTSVINPFKEKIAFIRKWEESETKELIVISFKKDTDDDPMYFPCFEKGKHYKNMKPGKEYTLSDLNLKG